MNTITKKNNSNEKVKTRERPLNINPDSELYEMKAETINHEDMLNNLYIIDIESKNTIAEYPITAVENESQGEIFNRAWNSAVAEGKVNNDERMNYVILTVAKTTY